jgi:multiple sugar transport system substrate-binding protein
MLRDAASGRLQINLVTVPRPSLRQVLMHSVAEGQAPDLAIIDSVWVSEFAAAGFLRPIDDIDRTWTKQEYERDFLPPVVRANRYDGRTYGVSAFADVAGLWYRRRELERIGAEPPATWNELRKIGRALAKAGAKRPIVMPGGSQGAETTAYCLIAFLASNAAAVLEGDEVVLDSPATVEALRFLRILVEDGSMPAEVVAYEWDHSTALLAEGKAAISFGGSYEAAGLADALGVPLRAGSRRSARGARVRCRDDELRHLQPDRSAARRARPAQAGGRLGRARPDRALDGTHSGPPLGRPARRSGLSVPAAD